MIVCFDYEFSSLSRNAKAISLGLFCKEFNEGFYCEFTDYPKTDISDWVRDNVIAHLNIEKEDELIFDVQGNINVTKIKSDTETIKAELLAWLKKLHDRQVVISSLPLIQSKLEFFSDVLYIDWLLLSELLSEVKDGYPQLPEFINYIPQDISSIMRHVGIDPDVNREEFIKKYEDKPYYFLNGVSENKHNSWWDTLIIAQILTIIENEFKYHVPVNKELEDFRKKWIFKKDLSTGNVQYQYAYEVPDEYVDVTGLLMQYQDIINQNKLNKQGFDNLQNIVGDLQSENVQQWKSPVDGISDEDWSRFVNEDLSNDSRVVTGDDLNPDITRQVEEEDLDEGLSRSSSFNKNDSDIRKLKREIKELKELFSQSKAEDRTLNEDVFESLQDQIESLNKDICIIYGKLSKLI